MAEIASDAAVFRDDRADVARRALPRRVVGLAGWSLALIGIAHIGAPFLDPRILVLPPMFVVVGLLMSFDVFALQWGPRVCFELSDVEFKAYRGSKLVLQFELDQVAEWAATQDAASTWGYWFGFGYSAASPFSLCRYTFRLSDGSKWGPFKEVSPPVLFRWQDRGGLDDVTNALIARLGGPWNFTAEYAASRVAEDA